MADFRRLANDRFPEPIGAYSNGLMIPIGDKNLIVLTGQIATDSQGKVQHEDLPGEQARYIFENISSLLNEAGATIDDIIRVVIYVTDMGYFADVSKVRNEYLAKARPVSTLVEINKLAVAGCKVEIEVTAIA